MEQPKCFYCKHEVWTEEPGWGWGEDLDKERHFVFHLECIEVAEGVVIA